MATECDGKKKDETKDTREEEKADEHGSRTEDRKSEKEDKSSNNDVVERKKKEISEILKSKKVKGKKNKEIEEEYQFNMPEYYIKEEFKTVQESLELFQNDELFFKPGTYIGVNLDCIASWSYHFFS